MTGFECTISVPDIQAAASAIEANSGKIVMPICTLAGIGRLLFFQDPEGNHWILQEVTTRLPGRIDPAATSFGSASDLESALRRAATAHGEREKRTGQRD